MDVSVSELSKLLGVSPNTIERWLRQGKLPVSRKGTQYRFKIDELKKWAFNHHLNLNLSDKIIPKKKTSSSISLSDAVQNGGVHSDIQGNDVTTVLTSAVNKLQGIPKGYRERLLDQLIERETALSTGIGNGIAIPHPRQQQDYLDDPMVAVCYLSCPVEYNALDNQPVSVLFIVLCPVLKMHLHLLSAISFCLKNREFTTFLDSQPAMENLLEKIESVQKNNPVS